LVGFSLLTNQKKRTHGVTGNGDSSSQG